MAEISEFFPYSAYRPNQKEMLDAVAGIAENNGILMIDAPTGSGKSSVVSALLAKANGRKILIAVRTVSQLEIFIRELDSIRRKKQPNLKFTYLIGKGKMCPLGGYGDVYRKCEAVKAFTVSLMQQRAERGSYNPAGDRVIQDQIRRQDRDTPVICPYFVSSRSFVPGEEGARRMVPSSDMKRKSETAQRQVVHPSELLKFSGNLCPYDMMLNAAKGADVVICNYHHLFNDEIREQLYVNLGCEEDKVILLLDEAHNLGDIIQSIESIRIGESDIEAAARELTSLRGKIQKTDAIRHILPRIAEFIDGLHRSTEVEDWFDPQIFNRFLIKGSLYEKPEDLLEDVLEIKEEVHQKSIESGNFNDSAIEKLADFLTRMYRSSLNPAFLTVYVREDETVSLEVRNIDPSGRLQELASMHSAVVLISGTLSPVDGYRRYYFGDMPVETLSLSNQFPQENRMVVGISDISSAFSRRQNQDNINRIVTSILAFSELDGNQALYFPSYQLMLQFFERCGHLIRNKVVFQEPRDVKEANTVLQEFIQLPRRNKAGILFAVCGGKWSEGLDYRGDQLTAAMVIGLPLAPYTPVRRMVNSYYKRKFGSNGEFIAYTLPAINKAMQALGRVLRTETDCGVLVLGDERYMSPDVFPGVSYWMQKELKPAAAADLSKLLQSWRK